MVVGGYLGHTWLPNTNDHYIIGGTTHIGGLDQPGNCREAKLIGKTRFQYESVHSQPTDIHLKYSNSQLSDSQMAHYLQFWPRNGHLNPRWTLSTRNNIRVERDLVCPEWAGSNQGRLPTSQYPPA
jgi:hypothetical protein